MTKKRRLVESDDWLRMNTQYCKTMAVSFFQTTSRKQTKKNIRFRLTKMKSFNESLYLGEDEPRIE